MAGRPGWPSPTGQGLESTFARLWRVDRRRDFMTDRWNDWAIERRVYVAVRAVMSLVPGKLTVTQYPSGRPDRPGRCEWSVGSSLEKVATRPLFDILQDYGHRDGEDWDEVEAILSGYFACEIDGGFWGR